MAALLLRPAVGHSTIIPGAYIVQLGPGQTSESLTSIIQPYGSVKNETNLPSFNTVCVTFDNAPQEFISGKIEEISNNSEIKTVWPVKNHKANYEEPAPVAPAGFNLSLLAKREAQEGPAVSFPPHVMTQVDKLHERGFTGKGMKVAIIDLGVDHTHPALGDGCLGKGCLIESYHNFALDECAPSHDTITDCSGHGTIMAGIIAAQPNPLGFIGASPGAKLGVYRLGGSYSDAILLAALQRAVEDGASVISMSLSIDGTSFMQSPVSRAVSAVTASGVACIVSMGNSGRDGMFTGAGMPNALGAASIASFISNQTPRLETQENGTLLITYEPNTDGGALSSFTSWGPTLGMDVKPQFGAPGENILSTAPRQMGDYIVQSGTSLSTPLVAGIYALLGEVYGKVQPELFERLLSATALPQNFHDGSFFYPELMASVPQQGAGLVQAFDAAFANLTTISPASLSFKDSGSAPETLSFSIHNHGAETVTYTVGNVPAITFHTFAQDSYEAPDFPLDPVVETATLNFDKMSITLSRGESATIEVSAAVPEMDSRRLPLWSGYITINGTDGSALSVPYQGLAGDLRNTTILEKGNAFVHDKEGEKISVFNPLYILPTKTPQSSSDIDSDNYPHFGAKFTLGTERAKSYVLLVKDSPGPSTSPADLDFSKALEIATSPELLSPRDGSFLTGDNGWNGQLKNGTLAPAGTYRLVVRALRVSGDPENEDDYDTAASDLFTIKYHDFDDEEPTKTGRDNAEAGIA